MQVSHPKTNRRLRQMQAWAMAHQTFAFLFSVATVLTGWAPHLLIEEDFFGVAVTMAGVVMLAALFVWNGERDPRNKPPNPDWMGGGGGG
jgi:hypothetical protein